MKWYSWCIYDVRSPFESISISLCLVTKFNPHCWFANINLKSMKFVMLTYDVRVQIEVTMDPNTCWPVFLSSNAQIKSQTLILKCSLDISTALWHVFPMSFLWGSRGFVPWSRTGRSGTISAGSIGRCSRKASIFALDSCGQRRCHSWNWSLVDVMFVKIKKNNKQFPISLSMWYKPFPNRCCFLMVLNMF